MSSLSSFAAASISVVIASFAAGCLFDASAFDSASSSSSSGGHSSGGGQTTGGAGTTTTGTGGSGAGTTSSGGQTSAGGSTTTTTSTGECSMDSQCPDPPPDCLGPRCTNGICGSAPVNDGMGCVLPLGICDSGAACMSGV